MNSTSTGFISDYSANTRFLQIYSKEYADHIIENFPFLFNNVVMNLETDLKTYKYILQKILSKKIVVRNTIKITLSLYGSSVFINDDEDEIKIRFKNSELFRVKKIRVHTDKADYIASVTNNPSIFKITYGRCNYIASITDYKGNRDYNSYPLPIGYSDDYSEETSWYNEDYRWIFDPQ